jgi:hypothetical protein
LVQEAERRDERRRCEDSFLEGRYRRRGSHF